MLETYTFYMRAQGFFIKAMAIEVAASSKEEAVDVLTNWIEINGGINGVQVGMSFDVRKGHVRELESERQP